MPNGRLPKNQLAPIPGGHLRKDAAAAWNCLIEEARRQGLTIPMPAGPNSSYRTYNKQQYYWHLYRAGRGNPAARPGTSMHGWGVAVDVTPNAWTTMKKLGPKHGYTNQEGRRVGEAWHWSHPAGINAQFPAPHTPRGQAALTPKQRELARKLRKAKGPRRVILKRQLSANRKRVWRTAQKQGWTAARRERYAVLSRLT